MQIRWENGISEGATIAPWRRLATIVWNSGHSAPIDAPADCAGRIVYQNHRIPYEVLSEQSVTLLRLA